MRRLIFPILAAVTATAAFRALRSHRSRNRNEDLVTASGEPLNPEALMVDAGASIRPQRESGGDWR
jgi:hypothetical protein